MLNNGDYYSNLSTKVQLKHRDPELYDFIEYCIKKYDNPDYKRDPQDKIIDAVANVLKIFFSK